MKTFASGRRPFELDYLAALTQAGLKPLSRWEGRFSNDTPQHLHRLGLRTAMAERRVATGRGVRELLISRSQPPLDDYLRRFNHAAVSRSADTIRTEGLLFGYPTCCIESFIARGYAKNHLPRPKQRLLFHWACPDCSLTPVLLPGYLEVHHRCRLKHRLSGKRSSSGVRTGPGANCRRSVTALALALALAPAISGRADPTHTDPHQVLLPEWDDPDGDLLTTSEEQWLGKDPADADQDHNAVTDGVDLALWCAAAVSALPTVESSLQPYVSHQPARGLETCVVCGELVNMGQLEVVHPLENQSVTIPYVAKHYLDHGSLSYQGSLHTGRLNPKLLQFLITTSGLGHFLSESPNLDTDQDGLRNWEEPVFSTDPNQSDSDQDGVFDSIDIARDLRTQVLSLPRTHSPEDGPKDRPFAIFLEMDGYEFCPACGEQVVMEDWTVIHPVSGLSLRFGSMGLHYLRHGGFRWAGGYAGEGRIDPRQLHAVLTGEGNGHPVPAQPDADGDGLTTAEEARHGCDPNRTDTDGDGVPDGVDLAYGLWEMIEALPVEEDPEGYRIDHWLRGLVNCPVCGAAVNMGTVEIVHPRRKLRLELSYLDLHGLQHGALARLDGPRLDLAKLEALLRPSVVLAHSGGEFSLRWKPQAGRRAEVYSSGSLEGPWRSEGFGQHEGSDLVLRVNAPAGPSFYKLVVR